MSTINNNLHLYDRVREVPPEAQRAISAGRLKGKTDINPMWRIKKLTEEFGPSGVGWYINNVKYWTVPCEATNELAVFCSLELFTLGADGWSAPIYGIGGNTVIAKEKNGLYLDDEAYKKAYTDAISVACKALGFGADVYWSADSTKYTNGAQDQTTPQPEPTPAPCPCTDCNQPITGKSVTCKGVTSKFTAEQIAQKAIDRYGVALCYECSAKRAAQKKEESNQ